MDSLAVQFRVGTRLEIVYDTLDTLYGYNVRCSRRKLGDLEGTVIDSFQAMGYIDFDENVLYDRYMVRYPERA